MSDLREAIAQAILGAATKDDPSVGLHPDFVDAAADAVLGLVEAYLREHDARPKLGLATTHELIAELMARADVAKTVGETWPLYSTVGGEPDSKPIALGGSDE